MRYILALVAALAFGDATAYQLQLHGLVTDYGSLRPVAGARVRIYKDGQLWRTQGSSNSGKYMVTLENEGSYVVRVDAPGYQGKCITIETLAGQARIAGRTSGLELEMRLPAKQPGIDLSYLDLPLGMAMFDPSTGNTRWNQAYQRNISAGIREAMGRYNHHMGMLTGTANRPATPKRSIAICL